MDSTQITLIGIATVSQRLVSILDRHFGRKTIESYRLDRIVVGSRTVLEVLNKSLLFRDAGNVDDRLVDWLKGEEPQACLRTLNQMEDVLNRKPEYGLKSFFKASHAEEQTHEAMRLFQMRRGYFHFLLAADIWNRESGAQRQSRSEMAPPDKSLCVNRTPQIERSVALAPFQDDANSSSVIRTKKGRTAQRGQPDLDKLDEVLKWLNAYSARSVHDRTILLRQPDTCTWLPNAHQYKAWRNTESSFLWLYGKPGAGKSVLAASVIDDIKNNLQDDELLVFFYCDFRNERSTSAAEAMRSLLSQLLQRLRCHMVELGDTIEELVEEKEEGVSPINNVMLLARYVSLVAAQLSQPPFIVIDALDECRDVELLLDAVMKLNKINIRIFVTSRPLPIIKERFSDLPSISMDMMRYAVSADIKLHTRRELDSHRRLRILDPSLKSEIYDTLCEKSGGMFRWVQCQLDNIKRCATAVRIRETLRNLPSDLSSTYERILLQINEEEEGNLVRRALDWLLFAFQPLLLSQIMDILLIDLGRQVLDRASGPVHGPALLDALGSLVTYDEVTDILILSHFSVKEYLIGEGIRVTNPAYYINQRDAHTRLVLLCICYLSVYLKRTCRTNGYKSRLFSAYKPRICLDASDSAVVYPPRLSGSPAAVLLSESHPFLDYVSSHGFRHLSYVSPRNKAVLRAIRALESVAQNHPSEWEELRESAPGCFVWAVLPHDFALCILIAFAPEQLLRSFITGKKLWLKDNTNPLIYAAQFCKVEHARILLSKGVSLGQRGLDVFNTYKCLPLEVASQHGNHVIVNLFLTEGSPVPHDLFTMALKHDDCPFPPSISASLLQTDEFSEWVVQIEDEGLPLRALEPSRYSFGNVSEQDLATTRRRLVQVGCNPSAQYDEMFIRDAARFGHVSTIKKILSLSLPLPPFILFDASRGSNPEMISFLLSIGCSADVATSIGNITPLHLALSHSSHDIMSEPSAEDCLKSIQALTSAGCSPFACNIAGETPLHLAARSGHTSVIRHFLSERQISLPFDLLLVASESHTASTIQLLVDKGVDVHPVAADGNTPLHIALDTHFGHSSSGDDFLECAEVLMKAGCNPCSPNSLGETAIDVAAKNGHLSVVEYFHSMNLQCSPDILLPVVCRITESSRAIPMIRFLVNNGANVHVTRPGDGDTLLHLTNRHPEPGCLKQTQFLVKLGCDPWVRNFAGKNVFHAAAAQGHISVMEYVLSLGMSIPEDALLTQFDGHCSFRTIHFLLERGGDIHTIAKNGDTLLHLAARLRFAERAALRLTEYLVRSGCNPCTLNSARETPLHVAARSGYISVIEYLLSPGILLPTDVLLAAATSESPNRLQTVRGLVDKGANVSAVKPDGDGALHLLTNNGQETEYMEIVKILVDAGCDPCSRNLAGETSLHPPARYGFTAVLEYLLSQGVPLPPDIILKSAPPAIRFFLGKGISLAATAASNAAGLICRTLRDVSWDHCQEFFGLLDALGWDLSLPGPEGETPIHIAVRRGDFLTVILLRSRSVQLPSDVLLAALAGNASDGSSNAVSLLRFLIQEGAGVNIADANGDTPLHLALRCKSILDEDLYFVHVQSWEIVGILLNSGADPSARNVAGQTPFDVADARGHFVKENFRRLVHNLGIQG